MGYFPGFTSKSHCLLWKSARTEELWDWSFRNKISQTTYGGPNIYKITPENATFLEATDALLPFLELIENARAIFPQPSHSNYSLKLTDGGC